MQIDSQRRRTVALTVTAVLSLVVVLLWQAPTSLSLDYVFSAEAEVICSPFDFPGYLDWDREENPPPSDAVTRATWVSLTDDCPQKSAQDWLTLLNQAVLPSPQRSPESGDQQYWEAKRSQALEQLEWLRGRTVLLIGDSVDRNALWQLGWSIGKIDHFTSYANATLIDDHPGGWDTRNIPHRIDIPELDLLVTNGFHYGSIDEEFRLAEDFHMPGRFEHRLTELFVPYAQQLRHRPSFIVMHSGMWDLAALGRRTVREGRSTNEPISHRDVLSFMDRLRSMINATQRAFPDADIFFRGLHRVGPRGAYGSRDFSLGMAFGDEAHFFNDVRVHQLRQAQEIVAREMGVPFVDFGKVFEGWQYRQDKVHPFPMPGGPAYWQPMLHAFENAYRKRKLGR